MGCWSPGGGRTHLDGLPAAFGHLIPAPCPISAQRRVWGVWRGGCHHDGDTEAAKTMGLWFSFFPHRECEMELLQEELDRMEMSCLQGESWLGRDGGRDDHELGGVVAVGQGSEPPACPHPVLGHVRYPRVSPGYARACAPPQGVPIQQLGTAALGVCHHPCRVLAEPSCLEQPPAMAGDLPSLERVSPVPGGWRTKLSSCGVSLSWG